MNEDKTPRHIGYIVDGNRRWAKKHGLPAYEGHLAGYEVVKDVSFATFDTGVDYVTLYIFSTENWERSKDEVKRLMNMVLTGLVKDLHLFEERNIKLRILGSKEHVSDKIMEAIESAEARTSKNTGGTLSICFNYGGRMEIVDAVKKIIDKGIKSKDVSVEMIAQNLYAPDIPDVDLVVRTSGEQRLSNFMLWRVAYSEMLFIEKNWPDMKKEDVENIIEEYAKRFRRFGK